MNFWNIVIGGSKKPIDYLFWFTLMLFTNPGGILQALGESGDDAGIGISDLLFAGLMLCFFLVFDRKVFLADLSFLKMIKFLLIFLIYYLVFFVFFIPQLKNNPEYSLVNSLIKVRYGVMNVLLVLMTYFFYLRSYKVFFKVFLYSSVLILTLFLITILTGVEILPVETLDRRFISINRLFMISYGLMPILMSMGTVLIVFKFKINYRTIILISFALMSITWILSLLRRQIIGGIILFMLTAIISNYISKKKLIPFKKIAVITIYLVISIFLIRFIFPDYIAAVGSSIEETYYVVRYGETLSGQQDARLGFGKQELQNKISENFLVGTGFDNKWRVSEEAGYEASDYPFLAAIAMVGVVGMLIFLPIYYNLYKIILQELRKLRETPINLSVMETYFFIVLITYFLYDILNYTYWFLPVSLFTHAQQYTWYIMLAVFFATRRVYHIKKNKFLWKKRTI